MKIPCKYPLCTNYKEGAKKFCSMGCNLDYFDWMKLSREERARSMLGIGGRDERYTLK